MKLTRNMKLTRKVVSLSVAVLTAAMALGCLLLFAFSRTHVLQSVRAAALTDYNVFRAAYGTAMLDVPEDLPDAAAKSFRRMLFLETDGSAEYALLRMDGSEIVSNNTGIDPIVALNEEQSIELNEDGIRGRYLCIDGKHRLVIGTRIYVQAEYYMLALVRDVTDVMEQLSALLLRCAAACILLTALSAAILSQLLRRSLRPVGALTQGAERFRDGDYACRIEVTGTDELSALAERFNAMASAIERHIRAVEATSEERRLLLSALSHEMKTPVTAITGYAHALTRAKLSDAQQAEAIGFIDGECRRLERLSGKLMQLISLNGADLTPEAIPAPAWIETLGSILQPIAKTHGIDLTLTAETETLSIERDLMTAAVTNLFDNAKKADATHIDIRVRADGISVRDDGRGIPPAEIERVTKPFYMLDKSRNAEGFGLGLALVQRIAQLHGGTLRIESTEGVGTTVGISFASEAAVPQPI